MITAGKIINSVLCRKTSNLLSERVFYTNNICLRGRVPTLSFSRGVKVFHKILYTVHRLQLKIDPTDKSFGCVRSGAPALSK